MRFAASRRKPARIYAHGNTRLQQSCSHSNAICNHRFKKRIELRTQEQLLVAEHSGGTNSRMKRPQPQPPHKRGTLHRRLQPLYTETDGFVRRLPPQNKAHATFMQPTQCILQHDLANPHPHRTTHTGTTTCCRTQRRKQFRMKRPQPQPPHTRGTIHRRPKPLYTEKRTVSCSGFLPKTSPMHSCSQYIAFCSITWLTRIFLRTWRQSMTTIMQPFQCDPQPEIQETHRTTHTGTTTRCRTQRRNQFTHETTAAATAAHTRQVPCIAGCSHFTQKNGRFRPPASSPKPAPCNIHAPSTMRFAASRG